MIRYSKALAGGFIECPHENGFSDDPAWYIEPPETNLPTIHSSHLQDRLL